MTNEPDEPFDEECGEELRDGTECHALRGLDGVCYNAENHAQRADTAPRPWAIVRGSRMIYANTPRGKRLVAVARGVTGWQADAHAVLIRDAVNAYDANSGDHFDVVFDGPTGPEGPRFVEVEDAQGRSISLGEWVEREDGYHVLRIPRQSPTAHDANRRLFKAAERCVRELESWDYDDEGPEGPHSEAYLAMEEARDALAAVRRAQP